VVRAPAASRRRSLSAERSEPCATTRGYHPKKSVGKGCDCSRLHVSFGSTAGDSRAYTQTQSGRHHHATHCLSPASPSGCQMCSTVTTFQRQDPSPDADCSHKPWPRNRCALWGCAQTHSVLGRTERTKHASQLGPCFCGFPSARKRVRTHCAITLGWLPDQGRGRCSGDNILFLAAHFSVIGKLRAQ
jgi:hypothetical protein